MSDAKDLSATPPPESEGHPLGEVLGFLRIVWALDHALDAASKRMESRLGITGPQRFVVRLVGRYPGITAGRLAMLLHVHPSTLTGILQRLEARQFIVRKSDQNDGRRSLLYLTDEGEKIEAASEGTIESRVAWILAQLPEDKMEATREVLAALVEALGAEGGPSGARG